MESAIEQKMNALGYDFTIKKLREKLHGGMTIRDYQNYHPEAQINWADYSCTYFTSFDSPFRAYSMFYHFVAQSNPFVTGWLNIKTPVPESG